jgi:hypothetical protein
MKHFPVAMLALGIMLAAVPAARADNTTTCTGNINGGTVDGNLIVPPGPQCILFGVTVTGNVQVQTNAFLFIDIDQVTTIDGNLRVETGATFGFASIGHPSSMIVHGNVNADKCNNASLYLVKVDGNVSIQSCTTRIFVGNTQIAGNFDCSHNSAGCELENSTVTGNVQINNNESADVGSQGINTISGNLQCSGNTNIVGGSNNVSGHKQGQCSHF